MSKKVYLSADFHFNHGNIIKYCKRPFLSDFDKAKLEQENMWKDGVWIGDGNASKHRLSDEAINLMDTTIINNVNRMVGEEDELWFLGDFCFAKQHSYYQTAKRYRDRIVCKHVYLVLGNHDHDSIGDLFENVYNQTEINVNGQRIVVNHYAMATWDGSHKNVWQCYGHSHSTIETWMDTIMPGRRSTDVGVDNAYRLFGEFRPFSVENDLQKILGSRPGHRQKS